MTHDCACGRPIQDTALICSTCSHDLAKALGDVTFLAEQLDIRLTRQARVGAGNGSRSAETPLPFDPFASRIADELQNTLSTWARVLVEADGEPIHGPTCATVCGHGTCGAIRRRRRPGNTLPALGRWLLARVGDLAHHEAGDEAKTDICAAVERAERAVDRTADRWYAGPCDDCGRDLYAQPSAGVVECWCCGAQYDVAERRAWLLAVAEDRLAPVALIARALPPLGHEVKADRLYKWHERGIITPHSVDLRGRPLFRVGDVLDALGRMGERVAV